MPSAITATTCVCCENGEAKGVKSSLVRNDTDVAVVKGLERAMK